MAVTFPKAVFSIAVVMGGYFSEVGISCQLLKAVLRFVSRDLGLSFRERAGVG